MGNLQISIGSFSASKQFNNASGAAIVNGFVLAQGGPVNGTEDEKLTWFLERISEYVRDVYRRNKKGIAIVEAEAEAEATTEAWE